MDLKAKLNLHLKTKPQEKLDATKEEISELIYEPINQEHHLVNYLPGQTIQSELGEFFLCEYRYPLNHFHGRFFIGALFQENLTALKGVLKDPEFSCPENIAEMIFLDTETTGLAGGAGTLAFMVGLGYFEDDEFVLQQYVIEDYHQELAMIDALNHKLQSFSHLVTFNGKSFDWPLLTGRFIYHRFGDFPNPLQIDLLHPARRYYKKRLISCNLGSLESEILGFPRVNDISGFQVPELFFRYVEEKDGRILLPVFQHNHWDILSLVSLTTHLIQAYLYPKEVLFAPEDLFSAGRIHEDLGQTELALECYLSSLDCELPLTLQLEVAIRLSFLYKRIGRFKEASEIWQNLLNGKTKKAFTACIEMAKYLEHKCKDYEQALLMTRQAKELLVGLRRFFTRYRYNQLQSELNHREQRLVKKMAKASGSCDFE